MSPLGRRWAAVLSVLSALVLTGGCARFSPPTDIPCSGASTCPTGFGCTVDRVCVEGVASVPVLTSLQPSTVVAGSASFVLTAHGDGFVAGSSLSWNGVTVPTTLVDGATLTATVPAASVAQAGTFPITVSTPAPGGGTSTPLTFTVTNPAPVATSVSPASAPAGSTGLTITVNGSNFVAGSVLVFDGAELPTTVSGADLTAVLPAAAVASGELGQVVVRSPGPGGGDSAPLTLTVVNPVPAASVLSPTTAVAGSSGQLVTLTGSGFVPATRVLFDGTSLPVIWTSSTQVSVQVPAALLTASKQVTLSATNATPGGGISASLPFKIERAIHTVLGGYPTDSGSAALSVFPQTLKFAVSPSGELYISEQDWHQVVKIDASSGELVRVVGTGNCFNAGGENVPANSTDMCGPGAMAFDASGNLFVFDDSANLLRKVTPAGLISTVAGNGTCANDPDVNTTLSLVNDTVTIGGVTGLAFGASGALYLSTTGCAGEKIRKLTLASGFGPLITTFVGTGASGAGADGAGTSTAIDKVLGLAVKPGTDTLVFSEANNHRVRFSGSDGYTVTVAGNGTWTISGDGGDPKMAGLAYPRGVVFGPDGSIYVAEYNNRIRRIALAPVATISTFAGDPVEGTPSPDGTPLLGARIGHPDALTFHRGDLTWSTNSDSDSALDGVLQATSAGTLAHLAGRIPPVGPGAATALLAPRGVALDANGNLFVSDSYHARILRRDLAGNVTVFAGNGLPGFSGDGSSARTAQLNGPGSLAIDSAGNVYFADTWSFSIRKVDTTGTITTLAGGPNLPWPGSCPGGAPPVGPGPTNCIGDGYAATAAHLVQPQGVLLDEGHHALYFSEGDQTGYASALGNRVRRIDLLTGTITTVAGSTMTTDTPGNVPNPSTCGFGGDGSSASAALLCSPEGLALDPNGDLLIADEFNHRIRKVNVVSAPIGRISTIAGSSTAGTTGDGGPLTAATFGQPTDLKFDASGALYVSDAWGVVRKVEGGMINRFAGPGVTVSIGDEGPATTAVLQSPHEIALSADGRLLYIADTNHNRIRSVGP